MPVSEHELDPLPEPLHPIAVAIAHAETEVIPVLSTEEPNDWLAAADALDPDFVYQTEYSEEWEQFKRYQMERAGMYLEERTKATAAPDLAAVARRAAVILNAEPEAPEVERMLGIRIAVGLEGQEVKCRTATCRRKWICLPEDPYFDAVTLANGQPSRANGICVSCMLVETRTDAAVPELEAIEGTVVGKPVVAKPRPRKAVSGG